MSCGPPSPPVMLTRTCRGPALGRYHHLLSVRGELLARMSRHDEAAAEFRRATSLTRNIPQRDMLLQQRAADCAARTRQITP